MSDIERRTIPMRSGGVLVRGHTASNAGQLIGRAVAFNTLSDDLGGFVERVAPGAFRKALRTSNVALLYNHNADHLLGRQSSGTLRVYESAVTINALVSAHVC